MKPSKLIRHLETKHPNRATKFRILPMPWSEFETSETYLVGQFHQEHRQHMKPWNCQVRKLTRLEKRLSNPDCWKQESYFSEKVVRQKWDEYLFPAILFTGSFQICRKIWKTRWKMKASPLFSFQVGESTSVTSLTELLVSVRYIHSGGKVHTCTIHRCALSWRTLPSRLKNVLDCTINIINYIKYKSLNTCLL